MSDIRYGACIEVSTDKEVDCDDSPSDVHIVIDGTADKDSRYEKETRIDGRDDSQLSHNSFASNTAKKNSNKPNKIAEQPKNQKVLLQLPQRLNSEQTIKSAAYIVSQATGQPLNPVSAVLPGMTQIDMAIMSGLQSNNPVDVINRINECFVNPKNGSASMNITAIGLHKNLIEVAKNKNVLKEHYDAVNTVLSAYKDLYEKKIDAKLAKDFQTLSQNFKYSSYRVEQAQRRYMELLQGKKFKISKSDQDILDKLVKMEKTGQLKQQAKKFYTVAKVFNLPSKFFAISEWVHAFNQAQKTNNWNDFWVKISSASAGMLVGTLVTLGITVSSLPVAFVVATLGVVASHYLEDEQLWQRIDNNVKYYFSP